MGRFRILLEKLKNPLRKQELKSLGITPTFKGKEDIENYRSDWMNFVIHANKAQLSPEELRIRNGYEKLMVHFPERARKYIEDKAEEMMASVVRPTIDETHTKIYEQEGVQVFTDKYVTQDFSPGSYNLRMVKHSVNNMLWYIRDIMPNRKPRIIVTDFKKHPVTRVVDQVITPSAGMYYNKMMYIDQFQVENPKYFIHEYAHYVADLVPRQTEEMLYRAYNQLITSYYRKIKKRKQILTPGEVTPEEYSMNEALRERVARKLGFPSGYGLLNEHEFFAVLIENWKDLPNNPVTYRLKSLVKMVLTRL